MADRLSGRIAVVGAGWAGCAAAVELARFGATPTLFEAARSPGGRARGVRDEERWLDNGQHILSGAYRQTLDLMRATGADPERLLLRIPLSLVFPGEMEIRARRLPAPFHMASALLGAQGLSWGERLAATRFMLALRLCGFRPDRESSVTALLVRYGQPERLIRLMWEPLCLAALNTPPERASARVFARVLGDSLGREAAASDLLLPRAPLSALFPEPALAFLRKAGSEVRLSCPVREVRPLESGFLLTGDGWNQRFDSVVLATAPWQVLRLLPHAPETARVRQALAALEYAPILTCTLAYPETVQLPFPMIGLSGGPGQWAFDREALLGAKGAGQIAVVISAPEGRPDDSLSMHIHGQITNVFPGRPLPRPSWHWTIVERRATFSCTPALEHPAMESGLPNLLVAGDAFTPDYPATLEAAVRSGVACARSFGAR